MRTRLTYAIAGIAGIVGVAASAAPASAGTAPDEAAAVDCAAIAAGLEAPDITTFVEAVDSSSAQLLEAEPPLTLFIPVNTAFDVLPDGVLDAILADEAMLTTLLDYHLVPGQSLTTADLAEAGSVATIGGDAIEFALDGETLVLNGGQASVICPDIVLDDASVQVIDSILQPPSLAGGGGGSSSSVPGSSTPGSSVPAGAAFDADQQAVATAWETVTDSSRTFDEQAPFIENAEALRATIEGYPAAAEVVGGIASSVKSVTIDGDTASITYTLAFNGTEQPYGELPATLINVDGSWIVPQDEYCGFQSQARNDCPA
ncbi:fasciclin domain-containing protein [Desertimonas flava]|uniref:fasciclin domain-containing protein n=1 Tax=Desertimonas flava TaxID=2064846 RepID=UPI000E34C1BF|nr:fasciclin domain-containing protein [Desertimonas flava]